MASFTIAKRPKANGDFSPSGEIVVKKTTRLYTENPKYSVKITRKAFVKKRRKEIENDKLLI